jgi:hypothetical protein
MVMEPVTAVIGAAELIRMLLAHMPPAARAGIVVVEIIVRREAVAPLRHSLLVLADIIVQLILYLLLTAPARLIGIILALVAGVLRLAFSVTPERQLVA